MFSRVRAEVTSPQQLEISTMLKQPRRNRRLQLGSGLDAALSSRERAAVDAVTMDTRGMPYRQIDTLVFSPSEDLGEVAGQHLRESDASHQLGRLASWFMKRAAKETASWELDLASYVLFDGAYAKKLIAIGRRDAHDRADQIRGFFAT